MPQNSNQIYIHNADNSVIYYTYSGGTNYYIRGNNIGIPVGRTAQEFYRLSGENGVAWISSDGNTKYLAKGRDIAAAPVGTLTNEIYVDTSNRLILVEGGRKFSISTVGAENNPTGTTATLNVYLDSGRTTTAMSALGSGGIGWTNLHQDVLYCKLTGSGSDAYDFILRNNGIQAGTPAPDINHLRSGYRYRVNYSYSVSEPGNYSCTGSTSTVGPVNSLPTTTTCSGTTGTLGADCSRTRTGNEWIAIDTNPDSAQVNAANEVVYGTSFTKGGNGNTNPSGSCNSDGEVGASTKLATKYTTLLGTTYSTANGSNACNSGDVKEPGLGTPTSTLCDSKLEVYTNVCRYQQLYRVQQCQCTAVAWTVISENSSCSPTSGVCTNCSNLGNAKCESYTVEDRCGTASSTTSDSDNCGCDYTVLSCGSYRCGDDQFLGDAGDDTNSACLSSTSTKYLCNDYFDTYKKCTKFLTYYERKASSTKRRLSNCVATSASFSTIRTKTTNTETNTTSTCTTGSIGKYRNLQDGSNYQRYGCDPSILYGCFGYFSVTECAGTDPIPASWTSFSVTQT